MLKNKYQVAFLTFLLLALCICRPDHKIRIKKYVAVGDSLTAGYQNGSLMEEFQNFSFPNLLARQLSIEDFQQPLISSPGIPPVLELALSEPLTFSTKEGFGQHRNFNLPRPYDNLGVPGSTLYSALNPDDSEAVGLNPFYDIVLRGLGDVVEQAISLDPELVTFWFGSNEILRGVTSGEVITGETVFPVEVFAQLLEDSLKKLSDSGAKIAIANIFDLTEIPLAESFPVYIMNREKEEYIKDDAGNCVPYLGPEGLLNEEWKITLGASGFIGQGYGIPVNFGGNGKPLSDEVTLSPAEITRLKKLVADYNTVIKDAAKKYGAVLVDISGIYEEIRANGYTIEGIKYTLDFPSGGLISYDRIHPTSLGYAILANVFIKKINEAFGYKIELFSYGELIRIRSDSE